MSASQADHPQGYFISKSSKLGERISVEEAKKHIFGMVIVNDWSARDHQRIEMSALGPFNSKNLATTISPWVVTLDALEGHLVDGPSPDEAMAPHLTAQKDSTKNFGSWYNISLSASVNGARLSQPNLRDMLYSPEQMVAHHTLAGAPLNCGDLMATGTVSSPEKDFGSLAELSWGGRDTVRATKKDGDVVERSFLLDGDEVVIEAWAGGEGSGIGWGECQGKILPATSLDGT